MDAFSHAWTTPKLFQTPLDHAIQFLTVFGLLIVAVATLLIVGGMIDGGSRLLGRGRRAWEVRRNQRAARRERKP